MCHAFLLATTLVAHDFAHHHVSVPKDMNVGLLKSSPAVLHFGPPCTLLSPINQFVQDESVQSLRGIWTDICSPFKMSLYLPIGWAGSLFFFPKMEKEKREKKKNGSFQWPLVYDVASSNSALSFFRSMKSYLQWLRVVWWDHSYLHVLHVNW